MTHPTGIGLDKLNHTKTMQAITSNCATSGIAKQLA
jgi:hypothetical protein